MKNVHFFGCSLTAGDELIDDELFPWKQECSTPEEYYSRRVLPQDYEERNKKLAYPAIMQSSLINTFNYARNGAGIRENIFNITKLISSGKKIDFIYFQITPYGRELVIDLNNNLTTIQIAWKMFGFDEYLEAKRKSHKMMQFSLEDLMDLITLHGYLKSHNIKHKFIELENWVNELRVNDLKFTKYSFLADEYNKLPILNLHDQLSKRPRTIGGHYDIIAHKQIAQLLTNDLSQNNIL